MKKSEKFLSIFFHFPQGTTASKPLNCLNAGEEADGEQGGPGTTTTFPPFKDAVVEIFCCCAERVGGKLIPIADEEK